MNIRPASFRDLARIEDLLRKTESRERRHALETAKAELLERLGESESAS